MPANRFDDLKNNTVAGLSIAPAAAITGATTNGTGISFAAAEGPVVGTVSLGVVHADTTGSVTFTESDAVGGTYTAIPGATAVAFTGTSDNTVIDSLPFERTKEFVRANIALTGGTLSAFATVMLRSPKKSY
jgi:hypothetical protein